MPVTWWTPRSSFYRRHQPCFRTLAEEVANSLEEHLVAWQHLAAGCAAMGHLLYKLRPKHHYMDHLADDVRRTRLNPMKLMSCATDESFLGYLKKIGLRCHQMNMVERTFQRYILYISVRWQKARDEEQ